MLRALGHDPEFVYMMQTVHDDAAREVTGNAARWRAAWFPLIIALAKREGLSMTATLQAARLAGWDLACIAQ